MHPETCPCCYANKYDLHYDNCSDPAMREPTIGFCTACGFKYSEHIKHPEREQVLKHRAEMRKQGIEIITDEVRECDELMGF